MKIALCISGHLRCIDLHIMSLRKFFLNRNDCDIFIHTWSNKDINKESLDSNDIVRKYKPAKLVIENEINFIDPEYDKYCTGRDYNKIRSMFYKIEACNNLKSDYEVSNNFTYDCVIRFRGDVLLKKELIINQSLDLNKIHIPKYGDYGGINDQLAFSNSLNMNMYSQTYSNILKFLENGQTFNPEFLNKNNLDFYNLEICRFELDYNIMHSDGLTFSNRNQFSPEIMKRFGWEF